METEPFTKLFELIIQLASIKQRRRREVFDQLLVPIHTQFGQVHRYYMDVFAKTRLACPRLQSNGQWTCYYDGNDVVLSNQKAVTALLKRLKKDFLEDRERFLSERIALRKHVMSYLKAPIGQPERRFLWAVVSYLLYPHLIIGNAKAIDIYIFSLRRKDTTSLLRTPVSTLWEKIGPLTDADEIHDLVDVIDDHLRARWGEVNTLWANAKIRVLRATTPDKSASKEE